MRETRLDLGLLFLRLGGAGLLLAVHGLPKALHFRRIGRSHGSPRGVSRKPPQAFDLLSRQRRVASGFMQQLAHGHGLSVEPGLELFI